MGNVSEGFKDLTIRLSFVSDGTGLQLRSGGKDI